MDVKKVLTQSLNSNQAKIKKTIISPKSNSEAINAVEKIVSRDLPNCIGRANETAGASGSFVKFYPTDIDILKNMSEEEQIAYKAMLIDTGRFYR